MFSPAPFSRCLSTVAASVRTKTVVTASLNGVLTDPEKFDIPVTPREMADQAYEAYNAGASVVHIHLRDQRPGKGHLPSWWVGWRGRDREKGARGTQGCSWYSVLCVCVCFCIFLFSSVSMFAVGLWFFFFCVCILCVHLCVLVCVCVCVCVRVCVHAAGTRTLRRRCVMPFGTKRRSC